LIIIAVVLILAVKYSKINEIEDQDCPQADLYNLHTSSDEIRIIHPLNRSYESSNSGHFISSYGFEGYDEGDYPNSWNLLTTGGSIVVKSEAEGHKNIVELQDTSPQYSVSMRNNFSAQQQETIEIWVRVSDSNKPISFQFFNSLNQLGFATRIISNKLETLNNDWVTAHDSIAANNWYHLRWTFNCNTHQYSLFVNQNRVASSCNINSSVNSLRAFKITTDNASHSYSAFIDAISYTWEYPYSVGANLEEGLLLCFETQLHFNYIDYYLDGIGESINGNTTIQMPSVGTHSIMISGWETIIAPRYDSETIYFTIKSPTDLFAPIIRVLCILYLVGSLGGFLGYGLIQKIRIVRSLKKYEPQIERDKKSIYQIQENFHWQFLIFPICLFVFFIPGGFIMFQVAIPEVVDILILFYTTIILLILLGTYKFYREEGEKTFLVSNNYILIKLPMRLLEKINWADFDEIKINARGSSYKKEYSKVKMEFLGSSKFLKAKKFKFRFRIKENASQLLNLVSENASIKNVLVDIDKKDLY